MKTEIPKSEEDTDKRCPRCGTKLIWLDKKVHTGLLNSQWFCRGCAYSELPATRGKK